MTMHREQRRLPYRPDQVYDVVADVEHYPQFLPWCRAVRISNRHQGGYHADMLIAFKVFRERYTSNVVLHPKTGIDVEYIDGPFRYLKNRWRFESDGEGGCKVDFFVDFEFKNRVLQNLIGLLFHEAVRRMVGAFETRARELYGPGTPKAPAVAVEQRTVAEAL